MLVATFAAAGLFREQVMPRVDDWLSRPAATLVLCTSIWAVLILRHRWARQAAAAVRDAHRELHAIVQAAPVAIFTMHQDRTTRTWNNAAERLFGWSAAEAVGGPPRIVPPGQRDAADRLVARVTAGGAVADHALTAVHRDGTPVDVSLSIAPLWDARGRVNGSIVVAVDVTDRVRAERVLAETEQRLERIADNAPGMLYQYVRRPDGSTAFPYVSSGSRDVYGLEPDEIRSDPGRCISMVVEEDRAPLAAAAGVSAATGEPFVWHARINHPRLGLRWIKSVSRPHRLPDGSRAWDGISLDVTAMKDAEAAVEAARQELDRQNRQLRAQAEALAEGELRFRSILDNSTPVIFAMDRDGRILFHNRRFSAPHAGADLVGRRAYDLLPPAAVEQVRHNDARVWETGRAEAFETAMRVGGGRTVHLLSNLFPLTNAAGQMTALCVVGTDITGQKAAEAELRSAKEAAERLGAVAEAARAELDRQNGLLRDQALALTEGEVRLQSILDNSTPLIFGKDRAGRFLFVNRTFATVNGDGDPASLVGRSVYDLFPRPVADSIRAKDEAVWQTGLAQTREEQMVLHGRPRSVLINAFPLTDAAGRMTALCGICTDTTAQKATEAELRAAKDAAERLGADAQAARGTAEAATAAAVAASAAKSDFLANMSHEIRTPLNGVVGMLSLLSGTPLAAHQRRYADVATASAATLLTLINDILDLSKIEAGKLDLDPVPFDLAEVARQAVGVVGVRADAKRLALACHVHPAVGPHRVGPADRVRQVLVNLLGNAVKFTDAGSITLTITAEGDGGEGGGDGGGERVRFAVTDTGVGIPPDRLDRLFKSFSQVDASTTRKYGGTGLGLAISRQLATLMGGTVGVESEVGRGSTFWFTARLPAGAAVAALPTPPTGSAPAPCPTGFRLLVAEDNDVNQMVIGEMLGRLGYAHDVVADGRAAVDAVATGRYDLVLMDCQMPVMDGFEATAAIRLAHAARVPVVALTANAIKGDRERCLAAGMDDYLSKPIDPRALAAQLARWLPVVAPPVAPPRLAA